MTQANSEKTIVVTGATSGIGYAVAEQLVRSGVSVYGIGRSMDRCRTAETKLHAVWSDVPVAFIPADLSLQRDVRAAASEIRRRLESTNRKSLDGLVNNAGAFSFRFVVTEEGREKIWGLNYLAPFLLTHELLPLLRNSPDARVVSISSGAHRGARIHWQDPELRRFYNGLTSYGQSKLALVLFSLALNRRLGPASPIHAFAADPGLVKTGIGDKNNPLLIRWIWDIVRSRGISPEESAKGIVYLLLETSLRNAKAVFWKHGKAVVPDRRALDEQAAARLWALSLRMCGISD